MSIVEGAGWRQTTPENGPRTYADLLEPCEAGPFDRDDVEVPSVTAILDDAWSKDLTGWHDWLIGRHVADEWPRLQRMAGNDVGVEVAQLAGVVLSRHSQRGTAVHDVAELEAAGSIDAAAYRKAADNGAGPWLPAVVAAFRALDLRPLMLEAVVFGPHAAGTLDGLAVVGEHSALIDELGFVAGDVVLWDNKSRTAGGNKLAIRDSEIPQLGGYLEGIERGYVVADGARVRPTRPDRLGVLTFAPVTDDTIGDRHWRFTAVDADTARDAWAVAVAAYEVRQRCTGAGIVAGSCTVVDDTHRQRQLEQLQSLDVNEQGAVRELWPGIPSLATDDAQTVEGLELLERVVDHVVTPDDGGRTVAPDDLAACIEVGRDWLIERVAELAAGGYRDEILDAVRRVDGQPLKSDPDDLTVEHLERYRLAIEAVERIAATDRDYSGTLKLRRQIVGPWALASDELTGPLREQLDKLPGDLKAAVRDGMAAGGIAPHSLLRWIDVDVVRQLIVDADRKLEGRRVELAVHVDEHGDAVVRSALLLAGLPAADAAVLDAGLVLDQHLEVSATLLDAVADGLLHLDDAFELAVADTTLERLLDLAGGKRQLLNAGRSVVHAGLAVDMPTSSDDVAGSALLAAHVAAELKQPQTTEETAA